MKTKMKAKKKLKKAAPARSGSKKAAKKKMKPAKARSAAKKKLLKSAVKVQHAPRKPKANEVQSAASLGSSLTNEITRAPREGNPAWRGGQSGDLQGISGVADADAESVEELLEDGQALEAEVVEGVENAPDEQPLRSRGRVQEDSITDYDDRNKI